MGISYIPSRMRVDVHQHLWSEPLVSALARRRHPPRVRRGPEGWWLDLAGDCGARLEVDDPQRRAELARADGPAAQLAGGPRRATRPRLDRPLLAREHTVARARRGGAVTQSEPRPRLGA